MNLIERHELITGDTVVTSFRSNKEQAQYHYFNTNGVYKKHAAMMQTLFQAVDDGIVNSGWLISCDADFHMEALARLAMLQRVRGLYVAYAVECIQQTTERAYTRLGRVIMGELDKAGRVCASCSTCDGEAYSNDGTECPDCNGTGNDSSSGATK